MYKSCEILFPTISRTTIFIEDKCHKLANVHLGYIFINSLIIYIIYIIMACELIYSRSTILTI